MLRILQGKKIKYFIDADYYYCRCRWWWWCTSTMVEKNMEAGLISQIRHIVGPSRRQLSRSTKSMYQAIWLKNNEVRIWPRPNRHHYHQSLIRTIFGWAT